MTSNLDEEIIVRPGGPEPIVRLRRIKRIDTFEIMETDLDSLENATEKEAQALGFFTACGGSLLSSVLGGLSATGLEPTGMAVYTAAIIVLVMGTGFFSVSWRRERNHRTAVMERIRSSVRLVEHEQVV